MSLGSSTAFPDDPETPALQLQPSTSVCNAVCAEDVPALLEAPLSADVAAPELDIRRVSRCARSSLSVADITTSLQASFARWPAVRSYLGALGVEFRAVP